ncbi:MAG: hypothetical protein ABI080_19770 [Candidatus Binatia bacterium]
MTTCGQVVPRKALGYLTDDLDCTGFTGGPANINAPDAGAAVYLEKKSRLDLRGFTIKGGQHAVGCDALVCRNNPPCSKGPCEVFNGTLEATAPYGRGISGQRPIIHDVTISSFWMGVVGFSRLLLSNATVENSASTGVMGRGLSLSNVSVIASGQFGVDAYSDAGAVLRLTNSTVTGSGTAALCDTSFSLKTLTSWNICALD